MSNLSEPQMIGAENDKKIPNFSDSLSDRCVRWRVLLASRESTKQSAVVVVTGDLSARRRNVQAQVPYYWNRLVPTRLEHEKPGLEHEEPVLRDAGVVVLHE